MGQYPSLDRRSAIKWTGAVAAIVASGSLGACRELYIKGNDTAGYGRDPQLISPERQIWPRILSPRQRSVVDALADMILPATQDHKASTDVGVGEFMEEWLSAPYPQMVADRELIMPLIDDVATRDSTPPPIDTLMANKAFQRLKVLVASAYYTSPFGIEAIGFVGNEPQTSFPGPPETVIAHLREQYTKLG